MEKENKKGQIHIYYGYGKGKTSILNGSALRALDGNFNKIYYLRFLKNRPTGENKFLENNKKIIFKSFYGFSDKFIWNMNEEERKEFKKETLVGVKYLENILKSEHNVLILCDEILDIIVNKFISDEELAKIIKSKNDDIEIMMSGHTLPKVFFEISNLISYVKPIKHYFNEGLSARKGIEF